MPYFPRPWTKKRTILVKHTLLQRWCVQDPVDLMGGGTKPWSPPFWMPYKVKINFDFPEFRFSMKFRIEKTVGSSTLLLVGGTAGWWDSHTICYHLVLCLVHLLFENQIKQETTSTKTLSRCSNAVKILSICTECTWNVTSVPRLLLVYTLLAAVKASLSRIKVYPCTSKARSELIERKRLP